MLQFFGSFGHLVKFHMYWIGGTVYVNLFNLCVLFGVDFWMAGYFLNELKHYSCSSEVFLISTVLPTTAS